MADYFYSFEFLVARYIFGTEKHMGPSLYDTAWFDEDNQ